MLIYNWYIFLISIFFVFIIFLIIIFYEKYKNMIMIFFVIDKNPNIIYNVKKDFMMTHKEIHDLLNIPLSTLDSWKKIDHPKHHLYLLLVNLDKNYAEKKISLDRKNHRILHILNRNTSEIYSWEDIHKAFSKKSYDDASDKEKKIYSKFFKECDPNDLENLEKVFDISKINVKRIYSTSPLKKISGVSKTWNRRFRIPKKEQPLVKEKEYIYTLDFEL